MSNMFKQRKPKIVDAGDGVEVKAQATESPPDVSAELASPADGVEDLERLREELLRESERAMRNGGGCGCFSSR